MFDLTKNERLIVIFLIAALLLGLGVSAYQKSRPAVNVEVKSFEFEEAKNTLDARGRININEAGLDELTALEGVGKVVAGRIIEYRNLKGRFSSAEDIKNVKGIGDKLFEKIKNRITVE